MNSLKQRFWELLDRCPAVTEFHSYRQWRKGWWYQVFHHYKLGSGGRLQWSRQDADHAKNEWTNHFENHVSSSAAHDAAAPR